MRKIKAHYDGKQIVLDEKVDLEPNTELFIILGEPIDLGACDVAQEHNHYLYGTPKANKGKEMSEGNPQREEQQHRIRALEAAIESLQNEQPLNAGGYLDLRGNSLAELKSKLNNERRR